MLLDLSVLDPVDDLGTPLIIRACVLANSTVPAVGNGKHMKIARREGKIENPKLADSL